MFEQRQQYGAPMYGGMMPQGGYMYNGYGNVPQVKINNLLSKEEIESLQAQTNQFSLGLTEKEMLLGNCTHRSVDGMSDTLIYEPVTGVAKCSICGYEFRPVEPDENIDNIKDAASRIIDILQTIKMLYIDIPVPAAREYFQIIPLIGKIPQLFEFAAKNFAKHEFNSWSYQNHNMGGMAMLQNLSNIFGSPVGAGYQQPMYGNPQQPMMGGYQQPYQGPVNYQQPQQPMMNPFGYPGASQQPQGYQPTMQGYQYNPTQAPVQPQPQVTPAPATPAAAPTPEVVEGTVTQTLTV